MRLIDVDRNDEEATVNADGGVGGEGDIQALPAHVEAWFAQERAANRAARGEARPPGPDWPVWEAEFAAGGDLGDR